MSGEHETEPMPEHRPGPEPALAEGVEAPPPGTRTMAIVRWALVAVMALVAVGSILSYTGVLQGGRAAHAKRYFCPMHPAVVQDHPGECPICHMSLVEETQEPKGDEAQGIIAIAPERIQLAGIKTAKVVREALVPELRLVGYVSPPETGLAQVQTRVAGWVDKIVVAEVGVRVKKGQLLATIYSPDLQGAQQELLNALDWAKTPHAGGAHPGGVPAPVVDLAEDARRRLEVLVLTRGDIAEIERTRAPLRSVPVRAPQAGTVAAKPAVEGAYVQPGTVLYELADLSKVWVLADVYEHDLARVRPGQTARLTLQAYAGEIFEGKVDFVSPTVDPKTRTMRARLVFANQDGRLKPGLYGDVTVALPPAEGLVVPRDAIVDTGDERYLFVALEGGRFQPRRIALGARAGDKVHVLEGVSEGETVVTTANFLIDSESRLRSAIQGQGAGPTHRDHGADR